MKPETTSQFRIWLQKIWQEHKDEVEVYTGEQPCYNMEAYVKKHKWWLKTVYKKGLTYD